ncbi:unnamed protein product, partial [Iphiclides podalirius]
MPALSNDNTSCYAIKRIITRPPRNDDPPRAACARADVQTLPLHTNSGVKLHWPRYTSESFVWARCDKPFSYQIINGVALIGNPWR